MSNTHRNPTDLLLHAAAVDAFTFEGRRSPSDEGEREMAELGIGRDGADYGYKGYRYERLADAIAYARLTRSRPARENEVAPPWRRNTLEAPNDSEQALMASLGIQFDGRAFRFAGFRYDRLADAVNYARRAGVRD